MATVTAPTPVAMPPAKARETRRGAFGILFAPVTLLILLFLMPLLVMVEMSIVKFPPNTASCWSICRGASNIRNCCLFTRGWTRTRRSACNCGSCTRRTSR